VLTLLLTRHGHTVRSEPEQYLGQRVEAPLSERGRADAVRLAERLAGVPIDRVISSPLARAVDTAAILAGGGPFETDDRLMELDYGAWEGLSVEEIERRFPGERARYEADPSVFRPGGGENGGLVAERVRSFVGDLLDWWESAAADRTIVVVGHSSLNRIMLAVLLDAPLRDYRHRFQQDWASLSVLRWPSRAAGPLLLLANDVAHLRGTSGVTWD
jgi:ribonuclease H / adenosylcobalamin/alpha-ribazole phosphatase